MKTYFQEAANLTAVYIERLGDNYLLGLVAHDGTPLRQNAQLRREHAFLLARHIASANTKLVVVAESSHQFIIADPARIRDVSPVGHYVRFALHEAGKHFSIAYKDSHNADLHSCKIANTVATAKNRPSLRPLGKEEYKAIEARLATLRML